MSNQLTIHAEVWIAAKILSLEKKKFTSRELKDIVWREFQDKRPGVQIHINQHCVANALANPNKLRYLTRLDQGLYKLFEEGDPFHESRAGSRTEPDRALVPEKYQYLFGKSQPQTRKVETTKEPPQSITENGLRDKVMKLLYEELGLVDTWSGEGAYSSFKINKNGANYDCRAEGASYYTLPDGTTLSHRSDLLIAKTNGTKTIGIEIKHESAVTDQFKSRSYDLLHLSKDPNFVGIMLYVKASTGISPEQARAISYPFKHFIHIPFERYLEKESWSEFLEIVKIELQ